RDTAIYSTDRDTGDARATRRIGGGGGRGGGGGAAAGGAAPSTGAGTGRASMNQYPQVTFNVGMTEAPDETAQGDWLNLVSSAVFSFLMAHVNYLRDGQFSIDRIEEAGTRDAVSLTMLRVRPVKPGKG